MTVVDEVAVVVDQHKRGIQLGLVSTALIGLSIALRSVRPFKKFTTSTSVPASFIKKHIKLHGRVMEVEPSGILKIDHRPIWPLPFQTSDLLPVSIDSIETKGLSTAWLQSVVQGEAVTFQPMAVDNETLSCIVIRKKKDMNIGVQLVSLGFASVKPIHFALDNDKVYLKYYKALLAASDKSETKWFGFLGRKQ